MANKKIDRNARKALNEFKYEMSTELELNDSNKIYKTNTSKISKKANKRMRNTNKF
ncbi:small, acid-soluble spore protein, alpha/beta type [Paramaledivibacter caminithermalis]|uniref:Small, acid-soluble spore protein, alpha/beta type n=1 Tax=Paramaledivibacter caminithermalis (strain DSM 15212 / CIP 107654 / DViRD3) TaxID=1121301 RepID=A0A1M6LG01_PARC5|nr:small, acid-soluble spore protein, alpha/beta type [Paramaledivibacter caminithermalis]SHJ70066.1 Small, acid-soluble spore protein, alpha/beta type [Paramaledivibacter caminithermalis DSM 15212]